MCTSLGISSIKCFGLVLSHHVVQCIFALCSLKVSAENFIKLPPDAVLDRACLLNILDGLECIHLQGYAHLFSPNYLAQ